VHAYTEVGAKEPAKAVDALSSTTATVTSFSAGASLSETESAHAVHRVVGTAVGEPPASRLSVRPPGVRLERAANQTSGLASVKQAMQQPTRVPPELDRRATSLAMRYKLPIPKMPTGPTIPTSSTPTQFHVGSNTYTDDQYATAVEHVVSLWTKVGGIVDKQKTAVRSFCGSGGAGATKGDDASIWESALHGAVVAAIGMATDGIGLAVGAAAEKGIGKLIQSMPAVNKTTAELAAKKVVDKVHHKVKEEVIKKAGESLSNKPKVSTSGGSRKLATPLATYQAVLEDSLDAAGTQEETNTRQQLLDNQKLSSPEKWVAVAAIHDALEQTVAAAGELQWNATSDGWFGLQDAPYESHTFGITADTGRVLIALKKYTYPDKGPPAIDAAYLGGEGVNEATLEPYNHRAIKDIALKKVVVMKEGRVGHSRVPCDFRLLFDKDNTLISARDDSPYGADWLAAHALGTHDADKGDRDHDENVGRGVNKLWDEIKDAKAEFRDAGGGSWSYPAGPIGFGRPRRRG
jgi:hypothetical protein